MTSTGHLEIRHLTKRYKGIPAVEDVSFAIRPGEILSYVPEEPNLYPYLTGWEYVQLAGRLRGLRRKALEPKIDEFLRLFSLWENRHCPLSSYPKGMRQKILLSAALLHNPEVLILDEPLSGLDVSTSMVLRELLQGLAARGRMILYSSHVLEVLEKVCSDVVIRCKGRVVAQGPLEGLRERMHQSSLVGIFAQIMRTEDHPALAGRIMEVIEA